MMVNLRLLAHLAEHELLGADTNAIAVGELGKLFEWVAVDAAAVAAAEIFHHRSVVVDHDASVVARDRRVVDGDDAVITTTNDGLTKCKIELLQQEAETIPGGLGTIGAHVGLYVTPTERRTEAPTPILMRTSVAFKQRNIKDLSALQVGSGIRRAEPRRKQGGECGCPHTSRQSNGDWGAASIGLAEDPSTQARNQRPVHGVASR